MVEGRVYICSVDGRQVVESRAAKWVHVEELDEKTPMHDVDPVDATTFADLLDPKEKLKNAVAEMLAHHATVHPSADCAWYVKLLEAWRRA